MKKRLRCLAAALLGCGLLIPSPAARAGQMEIATNLNGIDFYTPSWAFVDAFAHSREWLTRDVSGGPWTTEKSALIPLDPNGYPNQVPFDPGDGSPLQKVFTHLNGTALVAGTYTFHYEGTGTFRVWAEGGTSHTITATGPKSSVTLNIPAGAMFYLEIRQTGPTDTLRGFKLIRPGYETTYQTNPFTSQFLENLAPFTALRFMDWNKTNGNNIVRWQDRTTPASARQAVRGVAYEYQIALCNRLKADFWLCVPAKVDNDYVTQLATLVKAQLDPHLNVYVEYSNETWNGDFSQSWYTQDEGERLELSPERWKAGARYAALRSIQIWEIFNAVFGPTQRHRVLKVMGTQSGVDGVTNERMALFLDPVRNPNGTYPDFLAGAPYFGNKVGNRIVAEGLTASATVDLVLQYLRAEMEGDGYKRITNDKNRAKFYGIPYITYEGGQHLTPKAASSLNGVMSAANRDPRIYAIYRDYLDFLDQAGCWMFAHFSHITQYGQSGYWGALVREDEPLSTAHKYRALLEWQADNAPRLRDDFRDGNATGWSLLNGQWSVTLGQLAQTANSGNALAAWNAPAAQSWTDYRVRLVARSTDDDQIGVAFRYASPTQHYRFRMTQNPTLWALERVNGTTVTRLASLTRGYDLHRRYVIEVAVTGSQIQVTVDGESIFNVADTTYGTGTVALFNTWQDDAFFDNVTVW